MKRLLSILLFSIIIPWGWSQDIDPDYKRMIERKYDFPTITADSLQVHLEDSNFVILDTREDEEFRVSHIPGAVEFGYDDPDFDILSNVDKSDTIVVYCSIGVRSENIAEELQERGFNNVYNLYGGIFLWADQFRPMKNNNDQKTEKIHGYNKFWGRWVQKAPVVYE